MKYKKGLIYIKHPVFDFFRDKCYNLNIGKVILIHCFNIGKVILYYENSFE